MLEPLSAPIQKLLRELRLCTPADLRWCRGRVRRLAADLPAFDSVWIDALVQLGRLTPFQAQVLESSRPQQLKVGPCVLVDRLASSFLGTTYLARAIGTRQLRTVKLVAVDEDRLSQILARSQSLLMASRALAHPSIVVPQACERIDGRLVFVSRHVPGRTLTEFLIRRGRYPAAVVWQIGRQLADGLSSLHAAGLAHGDIRPSQVRLLSEGVAVLVDTGIQNVLEPELTPHSQLEPEGYDCVAPELIGTGMTSNPASDLYALGCLLWQLLAGRPPFPGGDPLAKLASHQTRRIRDVRDFAPDTPAPLAEMIRRLTSPNVADRPENAHALLMTWGVPRASSRRVIKRFVASFNRQVDVTPKLDRISHTGLISMLLLLCSISGLIWAGLHEGTRNHLIQAWTAASAALSSDRPQQKSSNPEFVTTQRPNSLDEQLLPLPEPDAQGVIELVSPGPYSARKLTRVGTLMIRSQPGIEAEIVLRQEPLLLVAERVQLQGLRFRRGLDGGTAAESKLQAEVLIEALELNVRDTLFLTHATSLTPNVELQTSPQRRLSPVAVCWKIPDTGGPQSGSAKLENVLVLGSAPLIQLPTGQVHVSLKNTLRLGSGALLQVVSPADSTLDLKVDLEQVTCRQSGSVLSWRFPEQQPESQQVRINARDCVFDVIPSAGGLLEFASGARFASVWSQRVKFVGDACLASEQSEVAVSAHSATNPFEPLDSSELDLEGITQGGFAFVGPFSLQPADAMIRSDYAGVRSTRGLPGIDARGLVRPGSESKPVIADRAVPTSPVTGTLRGPQAD